MNLEFGRVTVDTDVQPAVIERYAGNMYLYRYDLKQEEFVESELETEDSSKLRYSFVEVRLKGYPNRNETIKFLEKTKPINIKFNLNEELSIDIKSQKYSELPLEKKITKIIVDKKRDIIKSFPKVQFFINFVKDAKIGVLYLLMKNSKMSNFRNVIFDDKYKEFNVSWMRDKNNIFISFLCFS